MGKGLYVDFHKYLTEIWHFLYYEGRQQAMAVFTVPVDVSRRNHGSRVSPYSHWNVTAMFQASWNVIYSQKYFKISFVVRLTISFFSIFIKKYMHYCITVFWNILFPLFQCLLFYTFKVHLCIILRRGP